MVTFSTVDLKYIHPDVICRKLFKRVPLLIKAIDILLHEVVSLLCHFPGRLQITVRRGAAQL